MMIVAIDVPTLPPGQLNKIVERVAPSLDSEGGEFAELMSLENPEGEFFREGGSVEWDGSADIAVSELQEMPPAWIAMDPLFMAQKNDHEIDSNDVHSDPQALDQASLQTVENAHGFDFSLGLLNPLLREAPEQANGETFPQIVLTEDASIKELSAFQPQQDSLNGSMDLSLEPIQLLEAGAIPLKTMAGENGENDFEIMSIQSSPISPDKMTRAGGNTPNIQLDPALQRVLINQDSVDGKENLTDSENSLTVAEMMDDPFVQTSQGLQDGQQEGDVGSFHERNMQAGLVGDRSISGKSFQEVLSGEAGRSLNTTEVIPQMATPLRQAIQENETLLKVKLEPEELGEVEISFEIRDNQLLHARFVTDVKESREVIARHALELQEIFQDAGIYCETGSFQFLSREQSQAWVEPTESRDEAPAFKLNEPGETTNRVRVSDSLIDIEV